MHTAIGISRIGRRPDIQVGEPTAKGTPIAVRNVVLAEREWAERTGCAVSTRILPPTRWPTPLTDYRENRSEIDRCIWGRTLTSNSKMAVARERPTVYTVEDARRSLAEALRRRSFNVLTAAQAHLLGASDGR